VRVSTVLSLAAVLGCGLLVALPALPGRSKSKAPMPQEAAAVLPERGPSSGAVEALLERARATSAMSERELESSLIALGPSVLGRLEAELAAETPFAPRAIARVLGRMAPKSALPTLKRLASDERAPLRVAAAAGLEQIPQSETIATLLPLLSDGDPSVTNAAAQALFALDKRNPQMGVRARVEQLYTSQAGSSARCLAAHILGQLADPNSARALERGLRDIDPAIRSASLAALSRFAQPEPSSIQEMIRLLQSDEPNVRSQAAMALGRVAALDAVLPLIDALEDPHSGVAANAHWALRAISKHEFPPTPERWRDWWQREGKLRKKE